LLVEQRVQAKVLNSAAFAPAGHLLAVGGADRTVRLFDLTSDA